jgi:Uma2 family endonuclease
MATAMPLSAPLRMTFEEFLEWGDGIRAEWVSGEVEVMRPVSREHQLIGGFLFTVLRSFVEARQSGEVFDQTFVMKLGPGQLSGREPDVMFVAKAGLSRLRDTYLDGPAELVVEIVSPESITRDRQIKPAEYEQAGVREYWLIDPLEREAKFYQLQADGRYALATVTEEGIYRSVVLEGLWIDIRWLWQRPLPSLISVLKMWGLA